MLGLRLASILIAAAVIVPLVGSVRPIDRRDPAQRVQVVRAGDLHQEFDRLGARFAGGAYADACAGYARILTEAESLPDATLRRRARWAGALCSLFEGRYEEAFRGLISVREMLDGSGASAAARAAVLVNLGTLYQEIGDLASAEVALRSAVELAANPPIPYLAHAFIDLALVEAWSGRSAQALGHARAGLSEADRTGQTYLTAIGLDVLGVILMRERRYAEAESALLEGFRLRKLAGANAEVSLRNLGMLRLEQGDLASASPLLESRPAAGTRDQLALWAYLLSRARLHRQLGRTMEALDDLRMVVDLLRNRRARLPAGDTLRIGFEGKAQNAHLALAMAAAEAALAAPATAHGDGLRRESFEVLEENRAFSLAARAAERPWWRRNLSSRYRQLARRLRGLEQDALAGRPAARAEMAEVRAALVEEEAMAGGVMASPFQGLLGETRRILGPGRAFFSFLLDDSGSYRWSVTARGSWLDRLAPRGVIAEAGKAFTASVRRGSPGSRALGSRLYELLFEGIRSEIESAPAWILSLDEPLFEVPFAALVTPAGSYLAERHSLGLTPGAALYCRPPAARAHPSGPGGFLGVGDPIYNLADERTGAISVWPAWFPGRHGDAGLARLPAGSRELSLCARAWPGRSRFLEGREARAEAVREAARSHPAVLHFATHVVPDASGGGAIALSLSAASTPELLLSAEIERWDVPGAFVVLSGCRSGAGPVLPGTGLMGLTRSWLMAGADAVLASRWDTPDEPGLLLESFYRRLAAGLEPAEALRQSQVDLIREGGWGADPSYWATYFLALANRGAGHLAPWRPPAGNRFSEGT